MTSAEINALPEKVRRFIHDLETRVDPAGEVAQNALLRDQVLQLEAALTAAEAERDRWKALAGEMAEAVKKLSPRGCEDNDWCAGGCELTNENRDHKFPCPVLLARRVLAETEGQK